MSGAACSLVAKVHVWSSLYTGLELPTPALASQIFILLLVTWNSAGNTHLGNSSLSAKPFSTFVHKQVLAVNSQLVHSGFENVQLGKP